MSSKSLEVKPLTLVHLADAHLGFRRYHRMNSKGSNQREADISFAFKQALEAIIEINPDLVVVAGDLFHTVRPSNSVVTFCFRQLKRLVSQTEAKVLIIGGNHDTPKRVDSGSILSLFCEIDNVYVADKLVETFTFKELSLAVTCAPHAALANGLKRPLRAPDGFDHTVLVAHAQVDERLRSEFGGTLVPLQELAPNEWDYIALGHVHRFTQISHNAAYSGSLEYTSGNFWSDANLPRGFVSVSLPDRKIEFHPIETARAIYQLEKLIVDQMDHEDVLALIQERLDSIPGGIDGKLVKLEVLGITREVVSNLDYRVIRKYKARALHLQLDFRIQVMARHKREKPKGSKSTLHDEVVQYCQDSKHGIREPDLIQEKLLGFLKAVEDSNEIAID